MTTEAQIRTYTHGLPSDAVAYLAKGIVQVPVKHLHITDGGTKAEAILEMLRDGWTAIPF
ncbi:MAG: hypothetical protein L3J47_09965 [Sulfurovum sp.]|nr:hypothetical protein [Sulfurovum sp.]